MYLTCTNVANESRKSQITYEILGDKFILVNISINDTYIPDSSCYWRTGLNTNNPPLEILVDKSNSIIQKITFFISEDEFTNSQDIDYTNHYGMPYFETDMLLNSINDYNDKYFVWYESNCLTIIFQKGDKPEKKIHINKEFSIILNMHSQLIGFCIENMNQNSSKYLKDANFIK